MAYFRKMLKDRPEWGKLATFVPNKKEPVYNWFYYKEGFSKELVFNILRLFNANPGRTVLDPFCGSGTTMFACRQLGIDSIGFDVLPIGVLASIVKTRDYNTGQLRDASKRIFSRKFERVGMDFPPITKRAFSKYALEDIAFFMESIYGAGDEKTRNFLLLALISSSMKCSYAWKDGGVIKIRKRPVPPLRPMLKRTVKNMIRDIEKFTAAGCTTAVEMCDARKMRLEGGSIDFIITSPPYLNNIDYTKVYEIENFFIGKSHPAIRSYIGKESEEAEFLPELDIPNEARAYFRDMNECVKEMHRVCKEGAKTALVVGNAYYTQLEKHVESDLILSDLAEKIGFKIKEILVLNKRFALERRTIKKGVIRESCIIMEKR